MLSRALSLATVTLLIGCGAVAPAWAQATNLEAGKSPSQIFAGTCTACHKGPRGLLKNVPPGSLQGFLRQHYTTSPEMATLLAGFLVSNGAADTRYAQPKEGRDAKREAHGSNAPEQLDRFGRKLHPASQESARPEAEPREAAKPAAETSPDGRKLSAKQRLSRRGKPSIEEPPKNDTAKTDSSGEESSKGEAAKEDTSRSDTAKVEGAKPEGTKPSSEDKSESAKIETSAPVRNGDTPAQRPDPVPPVTPAPAGSPTVAVSSGTAEPAAASSAPSPAPEPPAVTASAPPPVAPAGPPAPPISQ